MISVSRKHKILFLHIPKAAGSSINALIKSLDPDSGALCERAHESASHIYEKHPNEFKEYFKFAVVRNPWARAVSLYHYRQKTRNHNPPHWPSRKEINSMSFRDVVLKSLEQGEEYAEVCPPRDAPEIAWLEPSCFSWVNINDEISVDYICKLESIEKDIALMFEYLGLQASTLPHLNTSDHRPYAHYYDDETREIVANKYAKDIEHFGYGFGD